MRFAKSGWHRADIIAAVHKKDTSLRALALGRGLSESALRAALQRPRTPSNRIIAEFLGVPMHVLWPQWFDAEGRLTSSAKGARKRTRPSSAKRMAA